ncbi:MAG: HNH endonuclease [Candidatus Fonsibacter sp.]
MEWRVIKDHEDYLVSEYGEVKSIKSNKILKNRMSGRKRNYIKYNLDGVQLSTHRLVAHMFLGYNLDSDLVIDHIDNNQSNNHYSNLQITTQRINSSKDKKNKTSRYTGVNWDKSRGKWLSRIRINGICKNLGRFDNEEEAYSVYIKKLKEING